MRTTIEINEELISDVMKKAGVRTKKDAIVTALKDYLKHKKVEELKAWSAIMKLSTSHSTI